MQKKYYYKQILYLPILLIILFVPLITYAKVVELSLEEADFWKGGLVHIDFFSYYKSSAFIILTCVALATFALMYLDKRANIYNEKRYYIFMLIYVVMVVLSTVMSKYKNVAIMGFIDMYQGMSVLISYVVIMFVVMNSQSDGKDVKLILYAFVTLGIIVGVIGVGQYLGYDFFRSKLGSNIIKPGSLKDVELNFTFSKYSIYATMYNTNFVGSFGALILPVITMLCIYENEIKKTILYFISASFSFATWLGSNSRAGYIGILLSVLLAIVVFNKIIMSNLKKIIIILSSFLLIFLYFNYVSDGSIINQFSRLNILSELENIDSIENHKVRFKEISIKDNTFKIASTNEELIGIVSDDGIMFENNKGINLALKLSKDSKEPTLIFEDEDYKDYKFILRDGTKFITGIIYNRIINFYRISDGSIKTVSYNMRLTEPVTAPRIKLFDYRETFASYRGYIWSRSIPMIKNTLLIGYGPDNYVMMFPQEDYIGRFNAGSGMTNIIVDKPHNMYLQTAINTGIISLIALILIWIYYIIDSIKLYGFRKAQIFEEYVGMGILLGIVAYLGAGMFNDNIISVAPLFWVMCGLGISMNRILKEIKNNEEKNEIQIEENI